jgi:hypothetical protein
MTISTHAFLRAQASAYADSRISAIPEIQSPVFDYLREVLRSEIRAAWMQGADAGYTHAKAEGRGQ